VLIYSSFIVLIFALIVSETPFKDTYVAGLDTMAKQYATYQSLKGRVVVISGGASGIGATLVETFHSQGSHVIFLDVDDAAANDLVTRLNSSATDSPSAEYHHCDLTNLEALESTATTILSTHPTIDVLINNAARDTRMATADVTPAFWDAQIAVNLRHIFFLTQRLIPHMRRPDAADPESPGGAIINMGSINWVVPGVGLPCYTASKAAIVGLTRTHAHEFGHLGIRVNSIMPGGIATERQVKEVWPADAIDFMKNVQALKVTLKAPHVARLALWLASDDSDGVSAQSWRVDGGWTS
jgi:D-xylose 1-dehydrogenase